MKYAVLKQVVAVQSALFLSLEQLSFVADRLKRDLVRRFQDDSSAAGRHIKSSCRTSCRGQATAEYALVILGAAALAMLFVAWATDTKRIGSFFNAVMRSITNLIT